MDIWIDYILATSSSQLIINGTGTELFVHKRGLRQGDPLSLPVFITVVGALQLMIQAANTTPINSIAPKIPKSIIMLQYADDTVIIINMKELMLSTLSLVLHVFPRVTCQFTPS